MLHHFARNPIGSPFIELQSVDSTNNYALTQAHAGLAQHGSAFFAHEQVSGKGQRGKNWSSGIDTSVILSILINPAPLQISQQFQLSACVAVSVHQYFFQLMGDDTTIKWPNDLYWQDRKAGGILIESIIRPQNEISQWAWAVAGIGININQKSFSPDLKNPVSLLQITGKETIPMMHAHEICSRLEANFNLLLSGNFSAIHTYYNQHLFKKNKTVRLKKGTQRFEAEIKGVSVDGGLLTQHAIAEEFRFGEIEWVL